MDIDVAPSFGNKPEFFFSEKTPFPLFKNNLVPLDKAVTSKSLSPSPSTSSIKAPVEYCFAQLTPD